MKMAILLQFLRSFKSTCNKEQFRVSFQFLMRSRFENPDWIRIFYGWIQKESINVFVFVFLRHLKFFGVM